MYLYKLKRPPPIKENIFVYKNLVVVIFFGVVAFVVVVFVIFAVVVVVIIIISIKEEVFIQGELVLYLQMF